MVCRFDVINFDGHPDGYSVLIYILIYEVHLSRAPLTIDVVPGEGVVVVVARLMDHASRLSFKRPLSAD